MLLFYLSHNLAPTKSIHYFSKFYLVSNSVTPCIYSLSKDRFKVCMVDV